MAVAWPLIPARFTPGREMRGSDLSLLADAYNELVRVRFNDRLLRTAQGDIMRGAPVFTVSATVVTATEPGPDVLLDPLGYALSDARDGEDIHVLRSGELTFNLLGLDPDDYEGRDVGAGEDVVEWRETGSDGVTRRYQAPVSVYTRREEEGRASGRVGNVNLIGITTNRLTGRRYYVFVRPDGARFRRQVPEE